MLNSHAFMLLLSLNVLLTATSLPTISLGGSISTDTVLYANATYTIDTDLIVEQWATLTAMPGTSIYLNGDSVVYVLGRFNFLGTAEQPVYVEWTGVGFDKTANILALYYTYYARPSVIQNLNMVANIYVWSNAEAYFLRAEYAYHRVFNVSVVSQRTKCRMLFNNVDNPVQRSQLIGMSLANTDIYAYGSTNLDIINATLSASNLYTYGSAIDVDYYLVNYVDARNVFYADNCSLLSLLNLNNTVDLNDVFTLSFNLNKGRVGRLVYKATISYY